MKTIVDLETDLVKPYIDTKDKAYAANIAPIETSPATSAHTAGTQIIYNGVLYDVTADIAANDVLATTGAGANIAAADDVSEQISNVKQALTNEVIKRQRLNTKNLLPFDGIITGDIIATSSPPSGFLANITLKQGDEIVFTCNQDSALTSSTRNTLLIDPPNGTAQTRIFEDGAITTDYHNAAGLHIIRYTATEDGEYGFYLWTHSLSSAINYSKFMVCFASDYDVDSTYSSALPNAQLLSADANAELGAHNLCMGKFTSYVGTSGVTVSVDSDNVVTLSSTGNTTTENVTSDEFTLKKGTYILGKNPISISGIRIGLLVNNEIYNNTLTYDEEIVFTATTDITCKVRLYVPNHTGAINNVKFYPIIRSISDPSTKFTPYAMTNRKLTERVSANTLGTAINLTIDTDYITTSDGYFYINASYQANSYAFGLVNGIELMNIPSTSGSPGMASAPIASLFVRKNTTIRYKGTNASGKFYPLN